MQGADGSAPSVRVLPAAAAPATTTVVIAAPVAAATVAVAVAGAVAEAATTAAAAATTVAAATTAEGTATTATVATTTAAEATPGGASTDAAGARLGLEAVAAVDGTVTTGLEGHLGVLAARGALHVEELACGAAGTMVGTASRIAAARAAAVRTAAWFVRETLGCVKFLFACREGKACSAIGARQRFVGISQPDDLLNLDLPYGHRAPGASGNEASLP